MNKGGHWPFTSHYNRDGRITPEKLLAAINAGDGIDNELCLELAFREREPSDRSVVSALKKSVAQWASVIPLDAYRSLLHPAAKRGVPCICTNPDLHKLVGDTLFSLPAPLPNCMKRWAVWLRALASPIWISTSMRRHYAAIPKKRGLFLSATVLSTIYVAPQRLALTAFWHGPACKPMFRRLRYWFKWRKLNSLLVICLDLSCGMTRTWTNSCYPPFSSDGA